MQSISASVLDVTSELHYIVCGPALRVGCYKWVTLYCVWSCPPCWVLQVSYTILCVVLPSVLDVTSELHYTVCGPALRVGCYK